jgi:hypothetical protein
VVDDRIRSWTVSRLGDRGGLAAVGFGGGTTIGAGRCNSSGTLKPSGFGLPVGDRFPPPQPFRFETICFHLFFTARKMVIIS